MAFQLVDMIAAENGWPRLTEDTLEPFLAGPGVRLLFVTGDPAKNLETNDVAVILGELVKVFDHRFVPAVVDQSIERAVRDRFDVWPTPSLIFVVDGVALGAIPKVRDWDDYLDRIRTILGLHAKAA